MQNCSTLHLCFSGYQRPWNRCCHFPSTTMHTAPSYEVTCHSTAEPLQQSKQCYPDFEATHAPFTGEITPVTEKSVGWNKLKVESIMLSIFEEKNQVFLMNSLCCFILGYVNRHVQSIHVQKPCSMESKQPLEKRQYSISLWYLVKKTELENSFIKKN